MKKHSFKARFTSRYFKVGSYSVAAVLVVIAMAVIVNLIVSQVPDTYTKLDMTQNQLFSISEQTEGIASNLTQDVTVYWIVQGGQEDSTVEQLLDRYESLSDKLSVVKKDPVQNPNFASQYTSSQLYNNSLIVVCGDKSRYVSYSDIFVTDYSSYYTDGTTSTEFNGESALTSAVDYVTSEDLPKLYCLTGHGESGFEGTLSESVESENVTVENLSLLTMEAVPEDAACVLIMNPTSDISDTEAAQLLSYLQNGGKLLLFTDVGEEDLPNLYSVTDYYGLSPIGGMVLEGNPNYSIYGYNNYLLPSLGTHDITSPLTDKGYYVIAPMAHGIATAADLRDSLTVTGLLATSSDAYNKAAGYQAATSEKEDGDQAGPFDIAAAASETLDSGEETRVVWIGSTSITDENVNALVSGGNYDFILNAVGWLCEKEDSISIHSKAMTQENLTVPSAARSRVSLVLIVLIPAAFIGAGIYVWAKRRKR